MKKCTKCDITYTDDKKFCKKCGASLSQEYNIDPKELAKKIVYEEKLKADSLNTDLLLEYSQFLYNNLLFKEAVSNLLKILAISENQKQANELLFKCYLKLSMYSDARDVGKQLLENNKTDMFLLEELANIETQIDNKAKAIEYYETILKIQPTNTKALYSKAIILIKNKELQKAINIFKELYKEDDRDRITIIYTGIDKCLSENYEGAIEILTPCLSEEDVSLSDLNNQRGFIYLIYSLCKTKTQIKKIDEWFSCLDFDLLKNFMQPKDEEILSKTILEIMNIHFARNKQDIAAENINYFIDKYLNKSSFYFTAHTNNVFAEIWANISELQKGLGLFSDAQASLKKAAELSPVTTEYVNKLGDVTALLEKNKKQQKRKVFTSVASLITLIIVIIISVNLFNRHKENKAWERAKLENTYESYGNYLRNYQDKRFSDEAVNLQEEVLWEKANNKNTVDSYGEYLQKYPDGRFLSKASEQKEDVIWETALAENTFESYEYYFSTYPNGKYFAKSGSLLFKLAQSLYDQKDMKLFERTITLIYQNLNSIFKTKSDSIQIINALNLYYSGNKVNAIDALTNLKNSNVYFAKYIANNILSPPKIGKYTVDKSISWEDLGRPGPMKIILESFEITPNNSIRLQFTAINLAKRSNKLLFTNNTSSYSSHEFPYLLDDIGKRIYPSSNFVGGVQKPFNSDVTEIIFNEGESIRLYIIFPMTSKGASKFSFVSPQLNGWQWEWSIKDVSLY